MFLIRMKNTLILEHLHLLKKEHNMNNKKESVQFARNILNFLKWKVTTSHLGAREEKQNFRIFRCCVKNATEEKVVSNTIKTKGHIKNAVALLGWHLSDEQLKKLQAKNIKTVVSVLDNDKSGIKGTELLKKYFNVIRFDIPNKDVGEMTKEQIKKSLKKVRREIGEINC